MSERNLDATLKANAESSYFKYAIFVDLAFPSGNVRVHNSVGTFTFGGNDYLGVGGFGQIEAMDESIQLVDNPIRLTLSSITPEIIDAVKVDDVFGRAALIYIGSLDADGNLEADPTNWITGYMEHASVLIGNENAVSIQVQTEASRLRLRNNKRWTIEDHQAENPGDLFLEFLPYLREANIQWGGEKVFRGSPGGRRGGEDQQIIQRH